MSGCLPEELARIDVFRGPELAGRAVGLVPRYVTAIGGLLEIVANFGDQQFKVG